MQMYDEQRPFSAGFWDRDERSSAIRRTFLSTLAKGTIFTAVAILAILSIYWGAFWRIEHNVHNLNAWVVDFDAGPMGQAVQSAALAATGPSDRLSWSVIPTSQFPNGPSDVIQAVLAEKCWAAVVVNPGASAALDAAVSAVNASYNGSLAATIYASEARNENSFPAFVSPMSQAVMNAAAQTFAVQHARQISSNPNITALLSTAPNVITEPLHFTFDNLRPFDVIVATAADFVGLIYLLIISFVLTNLHYAARMQSGLDQHLRLRPLILVRIFIPIIMYFFLSLIFSLLSVAFQIPFDRRFGRGGFVIFWMLSWVAMCALGLAIEAMITLITQKFAAYFMILWLILDVSVSFYPIEVLPAVFRYGYATPFYNVSRGVRTLIFSTRNQLGLNFGVLFAWIAISLVTIPLFQWFMRRRTVREWQNKSSRSSDKTI